MAVSEKPTKHDRKGYIFALLVGIVFCCLALALAFGVALTGLLRLENTKKHGREVIGIVVETAAYNRDGSYVRMKCEYTDENGKVYKADGQSGKLNSSEKVQQWLDNKGKSVAMIITDDGYAHVKYSLDDDIKGLRVIFIIFTVIPSVFMTACVTWLVIEIKKRLRKPKNNYGF